MSSLVVVACYDRFDLLPHKPTGTEAETTYTVLRIDHTTGALSYVSELGGTTNPAFIRYDASRRLLYSATESIKEYGEVVWYELGKDGSLTEKGRKSAQGYSTCYLTYDVSKKHMLFVNYWDSLIASFPINEDGSLGDIVHPWRPPHRVVAGGLQDHLAARQTEPHAHGLRFDPIIGRVAYVPDLGLDRIMQFVYDGAGKVEFAGQIPCGAQPHTVKGGGPRYIELHPTLRVAYLVNELSSTLSVYEIDEEAVRTVQPGDNGQPTLRLVQETSTIPEGWEGKNTCGRVAIDGSGKFVLTSNRGHDSISVHRIDDTTGRLTSVGIYATLGHTPRHFQLDPTNQFVLAANQDSDDVAVHRLDAETGVLTFTGHKYSVGSPNFVLASELSIE